MKRVRFDLDHMCGETHTVTAWTTVTPGLVVWNDGPNNVPCADEDYGWCISQPNRTSNVFMGSTDHQIAMERAERSAETLARVVHHQALDDGPADELEGQAVNDAAVQVEATPVTRTACGAIRNGRRSTSVEQVEPLAESPWRASCSRCGWYQDEHYPEDAEGEADEHQCPVCLSCGHQGPVRAPGEPAAP